MSCTISKEQLKALQQLKKKLSIPSINPLLLGGVQGYLDSTILSKLFGKYDFSSINLAELLKDVEESVKDNINSRVAMLQEALKDREGSGVTKLKAQLDNLKKNAERPESKLHHLMIIINYLQELTKTLTDCLSRMSNNANLSLGASTLTNYFTQLTSLKNVAEIDGLDPGVVESVIDISKLNYSYNLISYLLGNGESSPQIYSGEVQAIAKSDGTGSAGGENV